MLALATRLATVAFHAHATADFGVDFEVCCYISLLGLTVSLAFLNLCGPAAFVALASAG